MKRREFIAGLGAAAWPVVARAQQAVERMRRIAVLSGFAEGDPTNDHLVLETFHALSQLGWENGRNVQIEQRWAAGSVDKIGMFAKQLVALQPDVIIALTTPVTAALQRETHTIPIVFLIVSDPVGSGFVASLSRPGGNITGFINVEASLAGKSLAFLKEIAPHIGRAANMFNPDTAPGRGSYHLASFEGAARSLAIEPIMAQVYSDADIERVITSLGPGQGGLVVTPDPFMAVHRGTIIALAAHNKVPTAFDFSSFAKEGGLLQYGPDYREMFRLAASYMDRLLRDAKPNDLPVQTPTKFELVVNRKTAKALGLTIPETLLATADEVIE
jgi:putative tryptophan/tyrosine transport system substrate-binding protein